MVGSPKTVRDEVASSLVLPSKIESGLISSEEQILQSCLDLTHGETGNLTVNND